MTDIDVRIGAETGGLEAGTARGVKSVDTFGDAAKRAQAAVRSMAEQVRQAFRAPGDALGQAANRTATSLDRVRSSGTGAGTGARNAAQGLNQIRPAAQNAAQALDRASGSAERFNSSAGQARNAAGLLATAVAAIGLREFTQDSQDAAFAQFGFESALKSTTGSARQANAELGFIEERAGALGLVVRDSVNGFVALSGATKGTALQGQQTRDIWEGLITAGVALNRSNEQLKRGQEALVQIASKGVVSQEEIRQQLSEAIPGAVQIAARAMDMTTAKFNALVASGELLSEDFLPKFAAQLRREFGPTLEEAMNSPLGRARRELAAFSNATFEVKQAAGGAWLQSMTVGLRELNAELSSPDGLRTAADFGRAMGEGFTAAARAAIFLADNIDNVVMGAQLLAGGMLIRWLVMSASEARAAAVAYTIKGAAARAAGANAAAANATEAASNLSLRAGLAAVAAAEVAKAEAALAAAKADQVAAQAAVANARAQMTSTAAGLTYAQRKAALVAANEALIIAENGAAAAAGRLAAAQGVAAGATSALSVAMAGARAAGSALLALVGGPWGAALLAVGAATYFVVRAQSEQKRETDELTRRIDANVDRVEAAQRAAKALGLESASLVTSQDSAAVAAAALTGEVNKLADAHYRAAAAAKAQALEEMNLRVQAGLTDLNNARQQFNSVRARERNNAVARQQGGRNMTPDQLEATRQAADARVLESDQYRNLIRQTGALRAETAALVAEKKRELAAYLYEAPAAAGGAGGSGSGKGPSRMERWQQELDQMLVAEGNFFGESTAAELAFWELKREATAEGSDDRLAIDRKIFEARRTLAREDLRADLEELQTKQQLAEGDAAEKMRLQDEILARLREAYGEDSREYQRALQDKVRLSQEAARQQVQHAVERAQLEATIARNAAETDATIGREVLENERANLDLLADLGVISDREKARRSRDIAAQIRAIEAASAETQYQIARGLLDRRLELEGDRPDKRAQILAEIEQLEADHADTTRRIEVENARKAADEVRDVMREAAERWRATAGIIGDGFGSLVNNAVTGARTFGEVWQGIGETALNSITGALGRMVERWVTSQLTMTGAEAAGTASRKAIEAGGALASAGIVATKTGVHIGGETTKTGATAVGVATRTAIEQTGAAASIATSGAVTVADVANSAVRAAAGAYAAIAGIPVVGPILAPASAALALAAVLALGKQVFSARGGAERVANDGDMYELHKDEMVLPAPVAETVRRGVGSLSAPIVGRAAAGLSGAGAASDAAQADRAEMMQALALASAGAGGDTFNIRAFDSRDVKRLFERHGKDLRAAGERQVRDLKTGD